MRNLELVSIAWLVVLLPLAIAKNTTDDPRKNCPRTCGDVSIDYPFGIGKDCYLNETFEVSCTNGVLTLAKSDIDHMFNISEIRFPDQVILSSNKIMASHCNGTDTDTDKRQSNVSVSFTLGAPFKVSSSENRFRALGCDTTAFIINNDSNFRSRCDTQWIINRAGAKKHGGLGQCQIALPYNSSGYSYYVTDMFDYTNSACWKNCSYAVLAEEGYNISSEVLNRFPDNEIPLVAEWAIQDGQCNESGRSSTCGENAWCNYTASESWYHCYCKSDCDGNPYLNGPDGCQDGGTGFPTLAVALAGGVALAATLGASSYAYGSWAQKKAIMKLTSKLLQEFQNTGDVSSPDPPVEMGDGDPSSFDGDGADTNIDGPDTGDKNPRDFNQQDLKKAIKLCQKGRRFAILASRRRVARAELPGQGPVEIRKYTVQERSQLPLFVKGVRTLSRTVIHANVARLLGISTRERSLIYKQFSERTLRDSLHNSPSDRPSWEERLKIALGTARGLAFAHSKGLYHGNVKSSNILLDEKCNCKLVEFGVARVWSKNTLLNSSRGYVDQEYINLGTNQLIASMDVYSFGVVLVELITGQDPSSKAFNGRGRTSLAMVFVSAVKEKRLEEVVDHSIWAEERKEELLGVAELAMECLQQGGKGRPNMLRVRNILSKWVPKGPGPQAAQGGRPTNAARSRPGVPRNSNLQGQIANAQSQAQSALDIGQNVTGNDGVVFESLKCDDGEGDNA
ncbi:wall-associated receptor kinase 2-like protein [Cinnamomum micranthum f. kanehirae]|uniref:Wall-associated receptor kinase 2-like protein n=1 Tax=Cinnamomum micranthum f. kanehirae TaxID=337451 RepID=A0A443N2P5_9MAGN|nr:wall-associated receptor kinase 2-like protein [Cinnamomum micranthum f. kanehirae]